MKLSAHISDENKDSGEQSSAVFEKKLEEVIQSSLPRGIRIALIFSWLSLPGLLILDFIHILDLRLQTVFVLTISTYVTIIHILLKKGYMKGRRMHLVPLLPTFLPTLFFLMVDILMPDKIFFMLSGPIYCSYFIVIAMSGFLFTSRYSIAAGIASAAGYLFCYILGRFRNTGFQLDNPDALYTIYSPLVYMVKCLLILFAGFLMGEIARVAKSLVLNVLEEERQKQHITNAFGMIVDPRVRDLIIQNRIELGGETRENTVLFADVRGFTSYSQKMAPSELFDFMREYFDLMNREIREEEGTILEYIGDEVMVLFGAPLPLANHAEKACLAALRMQKALEAQNPLWEKSGKPSIRTGVGIHTGPMLVGCIGSTERHKYGALGDSVNIASRLQSLTKEYGVSIIASEETVRQCEGKFHTRMLDSVVVRGRTEAITIYEILATNEKELEAH